MLRTTREPSIRPTTPARAEPPRIFLLCAESLGPKARCVEDALRARGLRVTLALGRRARRWVRQVPPGSPSLRVLCVPQIDPELAQRLAQGRDDFHVVVLDTPARVVEEIERITGRSTRSRRTPRPSRMYLAQPTLVELQLAAQRSWGVGAVVTTVLLAVGAVGGAMLGGVSEPAPANEPAVSVRVPANQAAPVRRELDEPVLSAVRSVDPEVLVEDDAPTAARPGR